MIYLGRSAFGLIAKVVGTITGFLEVGALTASPQLQIRLLFLLVAQVGKLEGGVVVGVVCTTSARP